jgi:predicted DCC family thiol-disulfide oxidoreductase YuxK
MKMESLFPWINYWADSRRESGFNAGVARVLIGGVGIIRYLFYPWTDLQKAPFALLENPLIFLPWPLQNDLIWLEVGITLVILSAFTVGYRVRASGWLSALLVTHAVGLTWYASMSFKHMLIFVPLYLLWALFADADDIGVDGIRRTKNSTIARLNKQLQSKRQDVQELTQLRWGLIVIALVYFFAGFSKLRNGLFATGNPIGWATPPNLAYILQFNAVRQLDSLPYIAQLLVENPLLQHGVAVLTLFFEAGFLVAVIVGGPITPFALGLLGMHTFIGLSMNLFIWEFFILLGLFLPWDRWYAAVLPVENLTVLYDEHCHFCARSLFIFERLDLKGHVKFETQHTADSEILEKEGVFPENEMYVFVDGECYGGYFAFRRLLWYFRLTIPLALLMYLPPTEFLGTRLYRYIAANRDRYFVCAVDDQAE